MTVASEGKANLDRSEVVPKPSRPSRPNFNKLHAQPLPIKTYPLPALIPQNPFSLLQIAFTYLSHLIAPPPSRSEFPLQGYFSRETRSVHVTDEKTARILWEQGFFGKGSLSRSEPAWLEREKIRQGILMGSTSEEQTRKRREERKQFKNERAKKEREAIEEKLAEEAGLGAQEIEEANGHASVTDTIEISTKNALPSNADQCNTLTPSTVTLDTSEAPKKSYEASSKVILNQEHLQLNLEETFFLVYGLDVLSIQDPSTSHPITTSKLFSLCCSFSYFPPQLSTSFLPDNHFILSYVVYHHFRSLGWVVRPGIKFAVDYLLYNRGPVFAHAEFAVIVLPSYSHAYWSSTPELRAAVNGKEKKSWWWLHCINRVQAQVRKSLVVVYVEVPPPDNIDKSIMDDAGRVADLGRFLRRYRIRELILKRWTPNRSRD
ncbi:MAG: hypothetical protein Q9219_004367 [cf. Caloplaca sp. 3 TL-2023]